MIEQLETLGESTHCTSGLHCGKCRDRSNGDRCRQMLATLHGLESTDFDCPSGKPWIEQPVRQPREPQPARTEKRTTAKPKRTQTKPRVKMQPVKSVSQVGIRLAQIIEREVGAAMPCGDCKSEVLKLNMETPEQVRARRDELADTIIKNGQTAAPKWWQRVALKWAPEIAKSTVLSWIDEAIAGEPEKAIETPSATLPSRPRNNPIEESQRWISTAQMARDAASLVADLPPDITEVIGVARSGLPAASIIAQMLHVPLKILRQSEGDIIDASHGHRLMGAEPRKGTSLLVDDTVMSGTSLRKSLDILKGQRVSPLLIAAVYVNPQHRGFVDFAARLVPGPHLLEWNLFNSVYVPNVMFDMDGILCADCPADCDDDGERYAEWMASVTPQYLTRRKPIHIVTARLEKYRAETMDWLDRWGIQVESLTMGPWSSLQERHGQSIGKWKGGVFSQFIAEKAERIGRRISPCMFVESDRYQALQIHQVSGGVTICPATGELHARTKWDDKREIEVLL